VLTQPHRERVLGGKVVGGGGFPWDKAARMRGTLSSRILYVFMVLCLGTETASPPRNTYDLRNRELHFETYSSYHYLKKQLP